MAIELSIMEIIAGAIATGTTLYAAYCRGLVKNSTPNTLSPAPPVVAAPTVPYTDESRPSSQIFDTAEHGGKGPNNFTWDQMQKMVLFRTTEATKRNLLSAISDPTDREKIIYAINKAEGTNEYKYRINYEHGYYDMQAVCTPINSSEYKYQVIVAGSASDKQ